jgi:hypothetical protein
LGRLRRDLPKRGCSADERSPLAAGHARGRCTARTHGHIIGVPRQRKKSGLDETLGRSSTIEP